jgi:tetratricopeptide (TPR) repeat protein
MKDSINFLSQAATIDPSSVMTFAALSQVYTQAKRPAEAIDSILKAIDVSPVPPGARFHQTAASLLSKNGRVEESLLHYAAAQAAQPTAPTTIFNFGHALRIQGRLGEATTKFEQAVAALETSGGGALGLGLANQAKEGVAVSARLDLGLALRMGGRREEAAKVYARLLKLLRVGGRLDEAAEVYARQLEAMEGEEGAPADLAAVKLAHQRYGEAVGQMVGHDRSRQGQGASPREDRGGEGGDGEEEGSAHTKGEGDSGEIEMSAYDMMAAAHSHVHRWSVRLDGQVE